MPRTLSIDIETFSSVDLTKSGVYKYVESPDFEIMLLAYAFDDEPVVVVDLASGESLLDNLFGEFMTPATVKTAHNAAFERVCIAKHFGFELGDFIASPSHWECTMVKASMLGLPHALEKVGEVLNLSQQKDREGKALIRFFCMPCKPSKTNGMRTRNLPEHDPEKWSKFKAYCAQDVVAERAIRNKIAWFTIPAKERALWCLDQRINDMGVQLDPVLIENAIRIDAENKTKLVAEAVALTGLSNPNSPKQILEWLNEEMDEEVATLRKTDIPELLAKSGSDSVTRMLELRQEMSKTSVKKYTAMVKGMCADGRVRGLLQYYGANRTGRWAGRLVQIQNLPRNEVDHLDTARELVKAGDAEWLELLFGNIPDTLSQLIRTAFVAPEGSRLIAGDFSAIEARVIAWLAGEQWRLDFFAKGGDVYAASASTMFNVPADSIVYKSAEGKKVPGPNYDMRQKGKISELSCGFGGGKVALEQMGALRMGLEKKELPGLVKAWRTANPNIVKYWKDLEEAAIKCVDQNTTTSVRNVSFSMDHGVLFITLPSGRKLAYIRPRIAKTLCVFVEYLKDGETFEKGQKAVMDVVKASKHESSGVLKIGSEPFEKKSLTYEGMDQTTKQWGRQDTYGGKICENLTQAIARDCLAEAMLAIDEAGYNIICHVHDEIIVEVPEGQGSCEEIDEIMGREIPWAIGLPLTAESYETYYYKKD